VRIRRHGKFCVVAIGMCTQETKRYSFPDSLRRAFDGSGFGQAVVQQSIWVVAVVSLILLGFVHHVATRKGTDPNSEETRCQGGTWSAAGLEISRTPVDRVSMVGRTLVDLWPS